ncbi:MAG TPA: response regulator [Bryobacteraceae bacterium]|nr:response regulator [Bryobacteraceae bacterium]
MKYDQRLLKILFVEDEDALRQPVAKMLRNAGFQVLEAASGCDATDLLHANGDQIDAVLLDVTIPGRSSQEVVAEAARVRPDLKVILTSAYSEETAVAGMRAALIRRFIRKPFRISDLVETLRQVLSS